METLLIIGGVIITALLIAQYISGYKRAQSTHVETRAFPFTFKGVLSSPEEIKRAEKDITDLKKKYQKYYFESAQARLDNELVSWIQNNASSYGIDGNKINNLVTGDDFTISFDHDYVYECSYPGEVRYEVYGKCVHVSVPITDYPNIEVVPGGKVVNGTKSVVYHINYVRDIRASSLPSIADTVKEIISLKGILCGWDAVHILSTILYEMRKTTTEAAKQMKQSIISQLSNDNVGEFCIMESFGTRNDEVNRRVLTNHFGQCEFMTVDEFVSRLRIEMATGTKDINISMGSADVILEKSGIKWTLVSSDWFNEKRRLLSWLK